MHMLQKPDLYKIGQSSIQGVRIMMMEGRAVVADE